MTDTPRTAAVEELRAYIYAIHVEGNIGGTAMEYINTQLDDIEDILAIEAEAAAPTPAAPLDVSEFLRDLANERGYIRVRLDRALAEYNRLAAARPEAVGRGASEDEVAQEWARQAPID